MPRPRPRPKPCCPPPPPKPLSYSEIESESSSCCLCSKIIEEEVLNCDETLSELLLLDNQSNIEQEIQQEIQPEIISGESKKKCECNSEINNDKTFDEDKLLNNKSINILKNQENTLAEEINEVENKISSEEYNNNQIANENEIYNYNHRTSPNNQLTDITDIINNGLNDTINKYTNKCLTSSIYAKQCIPVEESYDNALPKAMISGVFFK